MKHIDHVGIAVKNVSHAQRFYNELMGLGIGGTEIIDEQKVRVLFIPITDSELEILESTQPDGPIAKFIENRGEGIHHVAFRVENIEEALAELKRKGVQLIDKQARLGAGGAKIAFIHPKETNGVLVEICERED